MSTNRERAVIRRLILVFILATMPVSGQTNRSGSQPVQPPVQAPAVNHPWLVTVVFELSVKDMIANWRSQGLSVE